MKNADHRAASWGLDVGWLLQYLAQQGLDAKQIPSLSNLDRADKQRKYLPIDPYLEVLAWVAAHLRQPHLGLDIAEQMPAADLGTYGHLLRNAASVGRFLDILIRYQSILMDGMGFVKSTSIDGVRMEWQIFRPYSEGVRHDTELSIAALLRMLRLNLGEDFSPLRVSFRHRGARPLQRYRDSFRCPVSFQRETDSIVFKQADLSRPLPHSDPALLATMQNQAELRIAQRSDNGDFLSALKTSIALSLEDRSKGLNELALQMQTSSRTLERKLKRRDTSYRRLREEVILELASKALRASDTPIAAIANDLGYSDPSAFVRAFKKLAGVTPGDYRAGNSRPTTGQRPAPEL